MTKRITLISLLFFLFSFTKLSAVDHYWVGGSGNWNDLSHWAATSGGAGGSIFPQVIPSPFDNVYFDANSGFTPGNNTVTINIPNIFCNNMNWTGAANAPKFISTTNSNSVFAIYGSLTFIQNMTFEYSGTIKFLSTFAGNTITTGGHHFRKEIILNGINGGWALQDSMSVKLFRLIEGDFYSNSNAIRVDTFWNEQPNAPVTLNTLNLSNSNLHLYGDSSEFVITAYNNNTKALNTNLDGANFYYKSKPNNTIDGDRVLYLNLADTTYINNVYFYQPFGTNTLQDASKLDRITATDKVYINYVEMYNKSRVSYAYLNNLNQLTAINLIHIDTILMLNNGNHSGQFPLDVVMNCDCEYIQFAKETGGAYSGNYGTLHFIQQGEIDNGYFAHVLIEKKAKISSGTNTNGFDYGGTFVGTATVLDDAFFLQTLPNYPLQFDTLNLSPAHIFYFQGTSNFTSNGWLNAVGNCSEPIMFKSTDYGTSFTIESSSPAIQISFVVMEYCHTAGTATFTAFNSIDKEENNGWNFLTPTPRTLYWVNGDGDWDDNTHWSLTSGGIGGECMPTLYDNVFFNANSGFVAGDSVRVNIPRGFCKSINWTGVTNMPVFSIKSGHDLYVHGSLKFVPNMKLDETGIIWFSSRNGGNTITTSSLHFHNELKFQGKGGSWSLMDSLSVSTFRLEEGDFYANSHSIRPGFFYAINSLTTIDTLDLYHCNIYPYEGGSIFEIYANMQTPQNPLRTNLNQTNFYYTNVTTGGRFLNLRLADTAYINDVLFNGPAGGGSGIDENVEGNGAVYINYVEMKHRGNINHREFPTTTDLVHVDTTMMFGNGANNVQNCDCNYTHIFGDGFVNSGLYNIVIIDDLGTIYNGHFNYVYIGDDAVVTTNLNGVTANFQGTFIGYAELADDGHLYQEITNYPLQFDTLKLTPGFIYEFEDITSFTQNGWLDAVGFCNLPITIKAFDQNVPFIISSLSDTITINYCVLENSQANGNADFIAFNTIDNGGNSGWLINGPIPRTLYWVGGNGKWSDPQHWSLSTGGAPGECMPTLYDDIFFDGNSGFGVGDSVLIDVMLSYCKSMDWTGALNNPLFSSKLPSTATLYINGSVKFINNMNYNFPILTEFVSPINGNTITSAGQHFKSKVTFNGAGSWTLLDSMSAAQIHLNEGDFYSNANSFRIGEFYATNPSPSLDTLNFQGSNIYAYTNNARFDVLATNTANPLYTNFNNTNFYYTSTAGLSNRVLFLQLNDTSYINEIIFSGSNNFGAVDQLGANNFVNINRVHAYSRCNISFKGTILTNTDLIHIDSVKMYNTYPTGGFNGTVGTAEVQDIYIARNGRVFSTVCNTTYIGNGGEVSDGFYNKVYMNGDGQLSTGANSSIFPVTAINRITFKEDGEIKGEVFGTNKPLQVDTIQLTPGKLYEFENTMTIMPTGWLDAIGTGSLPIIMRSTLPGTQGTIKSLTDSICINYIFMQDLDTAGTAVFHAGKISVDISNNTGWVFEDCCSSFELSELFLNHDTTICVGESVDFLVYYGQCDGCTFLWNDGDTSELRTVSPPISTTYSVAATRPQGCYSIDSVNVNVVPFLNVVIPNTMTVSDTATPFVINYQPSGGTWSGSGVNANGFFNPNAAGIGTHQLIYTVSNGNCITTDTLLMTVVLDGCAFNDLHFLTNGFDLACHGDNNGTIQITTLTGTAPFTYVWSNGNTNAIANNLTAGTYQVTITDSSGCYNNLTVTVTEPPVLIGTAFISSNYNGQAISFPGMNDGQATATVTGGIAPYTFLWNNGQTTAIASNLIAGTYTVTITDANGCTDIQTVTLNEPTGFISQVLLLSNYNTFAVSCLNGNDGSVEINVSGGTPPYSYLWSNGETDTIATGLSAGMATVTITDANNFSIIDTIILNSPTTALNATIVINNPISCNGFTDGNITASASGSVPNYTYLWENNSTVANHQNLGIGNYSVTVTDANGCTDTTSLNLTQPILLTVSITQDSIYNGFGVSCNGGNNGNVTAIPTGGTPNYTYNWNNGQTTASATNLTAGTQTVTVTDANGCIVTNNITLTEPTALTINTIINSNYNGFNISCNGENDGNATATISGGTGNYTYLWNNGQTTATATNLTAGTFTVTATDDNGCTIIDNVTLTEPLPFVAATATVSNYNGAAISCNNANDGIATATVTGGTPNFVYQWNNGQTTATATNLAAGVYTVTVTDANGCTASDNLTINEPTALANTLTTASNSCNGLIDITANTTGGTGNYTYQWNTNNTSNTLLDVSTGSYSVTIVDANNCQITDAIVIPELEIFSINLGNDTTLCINATLTLDATTPNVTSYEWQDGSTNPTFTITENGIYHVLMTNIFGCTAADSVVITYFDENVFNDLLTDTTICENTFWLIDATVPTAVQYEWQDGSTSPTYEVTEAGVYTVTVTNTEGCTVDFSTTISVQVAPSDAPYLPNDTILCEGNPIILNAAAENATDYIWEGESAFYGQNLPFDSTFIVTYAGTYSVNIANYCGGFTQFIEVTEEDCGCYPYVPNVFTPNNDGRNDEFQVYANCILQDFELNIYDRYGGRVFISNDMNTKWDGTARGQNANNGVYVWTLTFRALNASGESETRTISGDVTVIR
jgi:gliding motility-associated-like protein